MPNHVHVVVELGPKTSLALTVKAWKSFTARRINTELRRTGRIWHRDYFDTYIKDEASLTRSVTYVELNPVRAGLARAPQDWPWSSAARPSPRQGP